MHNNHSVRTMNHPKEPPESSVSPDLLATIPLQDLVQDLGFLSREDQNDVDFRFPLDAGMESYDIPPVQLSKSFDLEPSSFTEEKEDEEDTTAKHETKENSTTARTTSVADRVLSSVSSVYSAESVVPKVVRVGTERTIARRASKTRHSIVDPETLARKWRIGYETAKKTLAATTQMAVRTASVPLYRR